MKIPKIFSLAIACLVSSGTLLGQGASADGSRANLKSIAGAVKAYGVLFKGKAPESLAVLLEEGLVPGPNTFVIPGAGHPAPPRGEVDAKGDYTLASLPGAADLVAREKSPSHTPGEVLAIFKDGSIKSLAVGGGATEPPPTTPAVVPPPRVADARVAPPPVTSAPRQEAPPATVPVDASPGSTASPTRASARAPDPAANVGAPSREQRTSRVDDLPLAGLDTPTRSSNRNEPVVTFSRNADTVSLEANEKLTNALKLAAAAENQGNFAAASEHYRTALELKPDSTMALQGQAEALDRLGQLDASLNHYQRIQAISPTAPGIALKMAQLHVGLGDLPRAEKEAERAVLAAPNSGLAMSWLGTVELLQGERDLAEASFRRAMQREPRVVEQRYQTALQLLDTGQARRAATEAVSVLTMKPDHSGALFVAAEAYVELGSRERAVAYFQRYLELDAAGAYAARARRHLQALGVAAPPPPKSKATPPAAETKAAANKRVGDWLAGRPVTLPGKTEPIKPLFGGSSAPADLPHGAAVTATPPPATPPAVPAASGSAGELAATLLALVNALKQPNAQPGTQPTPQQLSELQARVEAYIDQEARAGRYQNSAQLINALMELERLVRSRAERPVAVATSPNFIPPPSDVSGTAAVLDAIAKANAASATPAPSSNQPTPGPSLSPGPGSPPAPNAPANPSGAAFRQLTHGQPAPETAISTSEISDYHYNQAKTAGDFRRMVKIDITRGRLARKNAGIGSENNNEDKFYESALYYQKKLGLGNLPEVAYTLNDIGVAYTESGTLGGAEDPFVQAQRIWEALAPTDAALRGDYAVMLRNFSMLREKQGNTAEAARLKAQADSLLGRRTGATSSGLTPPPTDVPGAAAGLYAKAQANAASPTSAAPTAAPAVVPAANGSAGDLAATLRAWLKALKQPDAPPGAQPTAQQVIAIRPRVDATIDQEARAGRYEVSADLINLLMDVEQRVRSRDGLRTLDPPPASR